MVVRFALPKGSLWKGTQRLLEEAGYEVKGAERSYRPSISDPELRLKILRPQEIPMLVEKGSYDLGITGLDWITETGADVEVLLNLGYGRVRLVLAVPTWMSDVSSIGDLIERSYRDGRMLRISTEYVNTTSRYIMSSPAYRKLYGNSEPLVITPWWRRGENDRVVLFLSFGATEAKPPEDADAIVDVVETGETLRRNNLREVETVLESTAVLIANRRSLGDESKREKILDVLALLMGVVEARGRLHIFVNVREENLQELLRVLPGLKGPTVSKLSREGWYAVNTVVDKEDFIRLLPELRRLAQGLVVHVPRQIMPLEEVSKRVRVDEGS